MMRQRPDDRKEKDTSPNARTDPVTGYRTVQAFSTDENRDNTNDEQKTRARGIFNAAVLIIFISINCILIWVAMNADKLRPTFSIDTPWGQLEITTPWGAEKMTATKNQAENKPRITTLETKIPSEKN
ncbi:MAG TPA: hypothetical protein VIF82_08845 [Burkholderiaceae bacterium]|jgi:hypothetical protein